MYNPKLSGLGLFRIEPASRTEEIAGLLCGLFIYARYYHCFSKAFSRALDAKQHFILQEKLYLRERIIHVFLRIHLNECVLDIASRIINNTFDINISHSLDYIDLYLNLLINLARHNFHIVEPVMSAKKRVFDKDLGVELVLDEELDDAANISQKDDPDNQVDGRGRKKAKFDVSQSSSEQRLPNSREKQQQQEQSRLSSTISSQNSSQLTRNDWPEESKGTFGEDSDDENYEDIDYGDDDDDDDFGSHHTKPDSEQDVKSQDARHDDLFRDDDDEHENIEHDRSVDGDGEEDHSGDMEDHGEPDDMEARDSEKETSERCKYWPSCNAGEDCSYYHPTKPCRAFPNCRFGKKCLYIHPPCKFNPNCIRPGCPFAHPLSNVRRQPPSFKTAQQPLAPRCKYGSNCMNQMCKFSHQRSEPCRFGANCLLDTCPYTHPSDVARKKPTSAFKWSAQS